MQNLNKISGFALSIPCSYAHTEREFSLTSNKRVDQEKKAA
jgi:hypothetical protein